MRLRKDLEYASFMSEGEGEKEMTYPWGILNGVISLWDKPSLRSVDCCCVFGNCRSSISHECNVAKQFFAEQDPTFRSHTTQSERSRTWSAVEKEARIIKTG